MWFYNIQWQQLGMFFWTFLHIILPYAYSGCFGDTESLLLLNQLFLCPQFNWDRRHVAKVYQPAADQNSEQLLAKPHQETTHRTDRGGSWSHSHNPPHSIVIKHLVICCNKCNPLSIACADYYKHHSPGAGLQIPGGVYNKYHQCFTWNSSHHKTLWLVDF